MRVYIMTINEIRVIAKLFYGEADAYDKNAPYDQVVQTMRDINEFRFQIAREKCHLNGYTKDYDSFTAFMAS
jgi:GTP-sensing pleiotropic transcriptional regulator CodY